MLNKVSCEYWLSLSLLGEMSLGLLPVFQLVFVVMVFAIEMYELFIYSGN